MWVQLFLWIATTLLTDYFRESLPNVTPSGLGDFTIPTATEGRFVPLAFGTAIIQGPNVTWYGDFEAVERTVTTGLVFKKDETIGFTYFLGMQMGLIRGQTAGIKRIWVGDDVVWDYLVDNGGVVGTVCDIDINDLFGGTDGGGGWVGRVRLFDGSPTQGQSDYLKYERRKLAKFPSTSPQFEATLRQPNLPNYRGFSYVTISNLEERKIIGFSGGIVVTTPAEVKGANVGETNQMRHMKFEIQTFDTVANGGLGDVLGLANDHHFIGEDLNPISLAYQVFTDTDWGRGFSESDMNLQNFRDAAEVLWTEGLGFSLVIDQVQSAAELIDTIEQHIDGYIGPNPITGEIEVILARQDYVAANEFQCDDTNIITISKYSRGEYNQTYNEVRCQYTDRDKDYKDNYAPAQDLANLIIQGRPRSKTMRYAGVNTAEVANKIVWRDIKGLAVALASATVEMDRTAWNLQPGKVVVVTDEEVGIVAVPFRIIQIRQGDPIKANILLDIVEDVFGNEVVAYTDPPPTEFIPPTTPSFALAQAQQMAMEAPYTITRNDVLFPAIYPRLYVGARHLDNVLRFEVNVDQTAASSPTGFDVFEPDLSGITMTVGVLQETLGSWQDGNGTFTIDVGPLNGDLSDIVGAQTPGGIGNLSGVCVINPGASNEEWVITDQIDWLVESPEIGSIQLTNVYRTALDSAMVAHTIGEPVWFIWTGSAGMILDKQFPLSNTLDVKLLSITQTDRVNLTDSPIPDSALPVVIDSDARYIKPLLPLELNFTGYGNFPLTSESPEDFIDFEAGFILDNGASPEETYQGAQIIPKPRLFRNENVIWQVQGLDDANTNFDAGEMQADKMRISWWIYDLDATPSATRGVDEFDSAEDVPWLTPEQAIELLKSKVPTVGRDTNVFNARIEIEVSHSPADVQPTSPENYVYSREIMYFDFVVFALFVIPPEAVMFYTRCDGLFNARDMYDIGYYGTDVAGASVGLAQIQTAQSVFGGSSAYAPDEPDGYNSYDVAGWHFPGPLALESPSQTFDWNNDWTVEFRFRSDFEITTSDKTFFCQTAENSLFVPQIDTHPRLRLFLDESAGNMDISYLRDNGVHTTHITNPTNKWFPSEDTWYSVAFVKKNEPGGWRGSIFIDGVHLDTGNLQTAVFEPYYEADFVVGYYPKDNQGGSQSIRGWMDEVRVTMGFALYSVDYVLPENASPADTRAGGPPLFPSRFDDIALLASFHPGDGKGGQADLSITALRWEFGGTSDIEPVSPFNGSPDDQGPYWSLRCDGVDSTTENTTDGAWLNAMEGDDYHNWQFGAKDWTMEVWQKQRIPAEGDGTALMARYNRPSARLSWWWYILPNGNQITFGWSPTGSISSQVHYTTPLLQGPASPLHDAIAVGEWHHHVVERKDDACYHWLDGLLIGFQEDTFLHVDAINGNELQNQADNSLAIGRFFDVSSAVRARALDGWTTEPRVTVGEAIYASNYIASPDGFTGSPPTLNGRSPIWPSPEEQTYPVPTQPFTETDRTKFSGTRGPRVNGAARADMAFLCHWIGPASPAPPSLKDESDNDFIVGMTHPGGTIDTLTPFPNSAQVTGSLRCLESPLSGSFLPDSVVWEIEDDDFCFECFVMFGSVPTDSPEAFVTFMNQWITAGNDKAWNFGFSSVNGLIIRLTNTGTDSTLYSYNVPLSDWTPVAGPSPESWTHVVCCRKGEFVYFFIDGVFYVGGHDRSRQGVNAATSVRLGYATTDGVVTEGLDGWLAETRITVGHYVYEPENFTPRTEPFDHHLTVFMPGADRIVGRDSSFFDYSWLESTVQNVITSAAMVPEDAHFQPPSPDNGVNPFYPANWQATGNGEGADFGPYDAGMALLDEPFTIEFWGRLNDTNRNDPIGHWDATTEDSWIIDFHSTPGQIRFVYTTDGTSGTQVDIYFVKNSTSPVVGFYFHFAVVRDNTVSPERIRMYIDGVELTPVATSPDVTLIGGVTLFDPDPALITLGSGAIVDNDSWDGNLEEVRVIKKVMYSGNFTPPTERLLRY